MSVKLMGRVWDSDLPPTQKLIMLSLADHATDDGRHIYPSLATICARTGLSERTVRANLRDLEAAGTLVDTGDRTPRGIHIYAIDIDKLTSPRGAADAPLSPSGGNSRPPRGQQMPPRGAADAPPPLESDSNRQLTRIDAAETWKQAQSTLRRVLTPDTWEQYILRAEATGWDGDTLLIRPPSQLAADYFDKRLRKPITRALPWPWRLTA